QASEIVVKARPAKDLLVCKDGQVNLAFQSRHLLTLALAEFDSRTKSAQKRTSLAELLRLDPSESDYRTVEIAGGNAANQTLVVCVNGNEGRVWQEEKALLQALDKRGYAVVVVDPRGVGSLRPKLSVKGHGYADPLSGLRRTWRTTHSWWVSRFWE